MPYMFRIGEGHGCVFVKWRGLVTLADNEAFFKDLEASPGFRAGLHRLHDYRDAEFQYTTAYVRSLLAKDTMAGGSHGFRKVAMLVSTDFAFGISRMYQILSKDPNQEFWSFRDLEKAIEWLGLPADIPDPFTETGDAASGGDQENATPAATPTSAPTSIVPAS